MEYQPSSSSVLNRSVSGGGSERPANVPVLPVGTSKPPARRPTTAPAAVHVSQCLTIDSFPPCQTSFWCPSCKNTMLPAEHLQKGGMLDRFSLQSTSTTGFLTQSGALHPQRQLFLAARKSFYRDHVFNCKIVRARQLAMQQNFETKKASNRFLESMTEEGEVDCLTEEQRDDYRRWSPSSDLAAKEGFTSARLRSFQDQMGATDGQMTEGSLSGLLRLHVPSSPTGSAGPSSFRRATNCGLLPEARLMVNGAGAQADVSLTESKRLGPSRLTIEGALSPEGMRSQEGAESSRWRPSTAPAPRSMNTIAHAASRPSSGRSILVGTNNASRTPRQVNPRRPSVNKLDWHAIHLFRLKVPMIASSKTASARPSIRFAPC